MPHDHPASGGTLLDETRRHLFARCGVGVGAMALGALLAGEGRGAGEGAGGPLGVPGLPGLPHFIPKAKRVIHLFMAGGPSQLDLFDYKPELARRDGQPIPASFTDGKRFAFMNESHRTDLLGSKRSFRQRGESGMWIGDLLPHLGGIADRLCFVRSCSTDLFNHAPAKLFMNTGTGRFGHPSVGAWVTYGLGSEADDLPGFVVMTSKMGRSPQPIESSG